MEEFDYSAFLKDKKNISVQAMQKYFWFMYIRDIKQIVASVLRCDLPRLPNMISLTSWRVDGIIAWIQEWQKKQEDVIRETSQVLSQDEFPPVLQGIPAWYITTKEAIIKYWQSRVLGILRQGKLPTQSFCGIKSILESQLMTYIDSENKKVQRKLLKPTKTHAVWEKSYMKLYERLKDY